MARNSRRVSGCPSTGDTVGNDDAVCVADSCESDAPAAPVEEAGGDGTYDNGAGCAENGAADAWFGAPAGSVANATVAGAWFSADAAPVGPPAWEAARSVSNERSS
jgi:hypothetical protein